MKPGIYRDLDNAAYHGGPGDSKSTLDIVRHGPINLRALRTGDVQREATEAQNLGTAFHAIVLEPEVFARTYCLAPSRADHPDAIDDRDVLVQMVEGLNMGRLPKLPTTGSKSDLVQRILDGWQSGAAGDVLAEAPTRESLESLKGAELKAILEGMNTGRQGLLSTSGSRHELADLMRSNGIQVTLWSDVIGEWNRNNAGREILTGEQFAQLRRMRDAVMAHPAARNLLSAPGEAELSAYWTERVVDPKTGEIIGELPLRCRPDYLRNDGIVVDLKTTQPGGASQEQFARSVHKWRYYVQHPFYLRGLDEAIQAAHADGAFLEFSRPKHFIFIVVENDACVVDGIAKGVAVYSLDADSVALGRLHADEDIVTLLRCYESGQWPGYSGRIEPLTLPGWAFTKQELSA